MRATKQRVEVSAEMIALVGPGLIDVDDWPADALIFTFDAVDGSAPATVSHLPIADVAAADDAAVVFTVAQTACQRIFGLLPETAGTWHLPSELRALALAIRDCPLPEPARATLRLAKSIELLCALFVCFGDGSLVPADGMGELSELDAARIAAARRLVDERWHEKLTLERIARTVGLNRAKLTRGFRLMYDCSVTSALSENRLGGARRMLLATDLPVSSVGYRCGYLNNASFTRAFSRRFGVAPTQLRQGGLAA